MNSTGLATMPAASGEGRLAALGTSLSGSLPIPAVRREVPEPILGLMETPAVARRPFPEPRVGQMEIYL